MTTDWTSVRLETTLASLIDSVIKELFVYGSRKYTSRSEFTKTACIDLLKKEGIMEQNPLHHNTGTKRKVKQEVSA